MAIIMEIQSEGMKFLREKFKKMFSFFFELLESKILSTGAVSHLIGTAVSAGCQCLFLPLDMPLSLCNEETLSGLISILREIYDFKICVVGAISFLIGTTVSVGCQCIFLLLFLPLCVSKGAIENWESVNAIFKFLTKPRRKRIERIPTPWEHFVLKLSDTALKFYAKFIGEEGEWPLNPIVVAFQLILWIYLEGEIYRDYALFTFVWLAPMGLRSRVLSTSISFSVAKN